MNTLAPPTGDPAAGQLSLDDLAIAASTPRSSAVAITDPVELRDLVGIDFTDEQLRAAAAPLAPGVIVAGAGSGKTSVMAARVVWLVGTGQVAPERVLGLTFTTKAAAELAARIATALERASLTGAESPRPGEESPTALLPTVATYHAFAGRLFNEHALRLGLEPGSRLLADATRFQLAARVLRRHVGPVRALTSPLRMLVGDLVGLEGELSEHLCPPERLLAFERTWSDRLRAEIAATRDVKGAKGHLGDLTAMLRASERRSELAELAAELRAAKRADHLIDFADQVAFGALLAESSPAVGAAERVNAAVVLLDEYQDTSVAQRRMLAGLFGGGHPVTAVGDPCQAIYGWRGASVSNLDAFPDHFRDTGGRPAATYSLAVNQRSGGRLLGLANRLAATLRLRHQVVELAPAPVRTDSGDVAIALHETYGAELAWVAERIAAAVSTGTPPGECAVLVRVRSDFAAARDALTAAGLPVEVVGLGGLLALPEVRDLVSMLQVLTEPTANAALVRLLAGPRWRLGLRDLAALGARARDLLRNETGGPGGATGREPDADEVLEEAATAPDPADLVALADALTSPGSRVSPEAAARCRQFGAELQELRRHLGEPLLDVVHRVLRVSGLGVEVHLAAAADVRRRGSALDAFLDVVAEFVDLDGQSSLSAFLAYLEAAEEHDRGLDISTPTGADAVQVMTVHKAKGLEWDVVALPNLTSRVFPNGELRDRQWERTARMLPGPLRGDAADVPALEALTKVAVSQHKDRCRAALDLDERRLGYVAFTRPRKQLLLSSHWWGPTQKRRRGPGAFLREVHEEAVRGGAPGVTVSAWAPEPSPEASNPVLLRVEERLWPEPADPAVLERRAAAAAAVRAARRGVRADTPAVRADTGAVTAAVAELAMTGTPAAADGALDDEERQLFTELDDDISLLVEAELRDRATTRLVPLPARLSASMILALHDDPDGLARALARPLPRRPVGAARRGTRFHAWLEQLWSQAPLLEPDELEGAVDAELGDAKLAELQEAFLASEFATRRPHVLEAPFSLPLGGRTVVGRIDAVFDLGDGRYDVIDWKTGSETADPVQLAIYRLAWARLAGVPVEAVQAAFFYVSTGRLVRPSLLDEAELVSRVE